MFPTSTTGESISSRMLQGIPGPQQILKGLTGSLGLSSLSEPDVISSQNSFQQCPLPELSCRIQYHGQDTCCFNYPGGQMLQTQFWDTDPVTGPEDSWTIHGLWPDHCDGGFDQFCDSTRRYSNISLILVDAGRGDILDYISTFWKDYKGDDATLWEHEWNKHGTCISTLEPHCYAEYYPQQEVVEYFDKAAELFKQLPTYEILANAGISPSHTNTYTLNEIQDTLAKAHGAPVTLRCRRGALNEVWYHFNVAGPLQTGKFVASEPDGMKSNCPATGLRYEPKTPKQKPEPTRTTTGISKPTGTGVPDERRGNLMVSTSGHVRGCIISRGIWYTSGTCATFNSKKVTDNTFTLTSSKGPCTFQRDILRCGAHIRNPTEFSLEGGKLSYRGSTTFYADKAPKGHTQSKVFASKSDHPVELSITWKPRH